MLLRYRSTCSTPAQDVDEIDIRKLYLAFFVTPVIINQEQALIDSKEVRHPKVAMKKSMLMERANYSVHIVHPVSNKSPPENLVVSERLHRNTKPSTRKLLVSEEVSREPPFSTEVMKSVSVLLDELDQYPLLIGVVVGVAQLRDEYPAVSSRQTSPFQ